MEENIKQPEAATENLPALNPSLATVIDQSSFNRTKAEEWARSYSPFMAQIGELSHSLKAMDKENPTSEDALVAREKRLAILKVRTEAEAKKKTDKEMIVIEGRLLDGLFKTVENSAKLTEAEYAEIEKFEENRQKKILDEIFNARTLKLQEAGIDHRYVDIRTMDDHTFDGYFSEQNELISARKEKEAREERERKEKEEEAEKIRVEKELKLKEENERLKKEKEESERLAKQQAESLQKLKDKNKSAAVNFLVKLGFIENGKMMTLNGVTPIDVHLDYISDFDSEEKIKNFTSFISDKIEKNKEIEKQKQVNARLLKEKEESDRKLKDQQEADKKRVDEQNRLAQEALKKEQAAKNADDQTKVKALFASLNSIEIPDMKSEAGKEISRTVIQGIADLKKQIISLSSKLV